MVVCLFTKLLINTFFHISIWCGRLLIATMRDVTHSGVKKNQDDFENCASLAMLTF